LLYEDGVDAVDSCLYIMGGEPLRIAVLGSGAMGMLFGGYLSKHNEVVLLDIDRAKVDQDQQGRHPHPEPGGNVNAADPKAAMSAEGLGVMDLVIVSVKSHGFERRLKANQRLIGPDTYVLSLQNGFGHDGRHEGICCGEKDCPRNYAT